jgi:hypothetical protein
MELSCANATDPQSGSTVSRHAALPLLPVRRGGDIRAAMRGQDWRDAGCRWQGKNGQLRLEGRSRHRRIVILRRRLEHSLALAERDDAGQLRLSFAEIDDGAEVWEFAVLVTSLDS